MASGGKLERSKSPESPTFLGWAQAQWGSGGQASFRGASALWLRKLNRPGWKGEVEEEEEE